ncbi:MAG: hypothetical protein IK144_12095 [Bacteroidaceae bacterium]|nr:hypothetical protein [Bacteroidaceae bacterium]
MDHNIKLVRIAEIMGVSEASVNSCFRHHNDVHGNPRSFTRYNIRKLNVALEQMADELRGCMLTFGSDRTFTNMRGSTYDPALIEPIKRIGNLLNLTALVSRVLGWNQNKKENTLVSPSSKNYGNISKADADRINAELLAVAGVLSSYEVVPDESSSSSSSSESPSVKTPETKKDKKGTRKRMEDTFASQAYPWEDTSLSLPERRRLYREQFPGDVLLFRVNGGYTAEGDDALLVHEIDRSIEIYTNVETGLVTSYIDSEQMSNILTRLSAQEKRVMFTDMYGCE